MTVWSSDRLCRTKASIENNEIRFRATDGPQEFRFSTNGFSYSDGKQTRVYRRMTDSGSDKWESEDQAQYETFNPRVKLVREKLVRQLPLRSDHVLGEAVHPAMEKNVFYCSESQSQDDALGIMRERRVDYLIVLDDQLKVVGTLWMEDLVPSYARRYHSG
jgi:CBS domain-containing protein